MIFCRREHGGHRESRILSLCTLCSLWLILLIATAVIPAAPAPVQNFNGQAFLYVNNNDFENSVSAFSVAQDGRLTPLRGSPFPTGGIGGKTSNIGGIAICRRNRLLFVTNNAEASVSGFKINGDGTLSRLAGGPVFSEGRFSTGVVCNRRGNRLFVANVQSDSISSFIVDDNGSLQHAVNSPFRAGNGPLALALNRNGTVLFASHEFSRSVGSYQVDSGGGLRQTGNFGTFGFTEHGLALHLETARLYVADLGGNSISGFRVDLNTGVLTPLPNSPYFTDGDRPIDVAVHPTGNFVFVSNNNNTAITVFSANSDGSLRAVSGSPFTADGQGPSGLVVNGAGTLLFVANGGFGGSKDISVYRIESSGRIAPIQGSPFTTDSIGIPSALALFELPAPPKIIGVRFAKKKTRLIISGTGFDASPVVAVNGKSVPSSRIFSVTDLEITLSGTPSDLNLLRGDNRISVTAEGQISNVFILKF